MRPGIERFSKILRTCGVVAVVVAGGGLIAHAGSVTVPNTFQSGTVVSSSEMNANFAALADAITRSKPAIACANFTGTSPNLGDAMADVAKVSLAVPGPGTVLVTVTGTLVVEHTSGNMEAARLNLSNVSGLGSPFQAGWTINPSWGGGHYEQPFALQGYYPVMLGETLTYYLTGQRTFAKEAITVTNVTLCAAFTPE